MYKYFSLAINNGHGQKRRDLSRSASVCKAAVKIGAAVAEETPVSPIALNVPKVERVDEHPLIPFAEASDKRAGVIRYKGMTVEELRRPTVLLQADTVGGDHRNRIGDGMALHGALPSLMRV